MLLRLAVVAAVACAVITAHEDSKPDCTKAGDGYYTKGCSSKFWRCVNDRLYNYDCPRGLYFNPLKRKCEYKNDVAICNEGHQMDSTHVIKASAEFNCTSLPDGPYKPRDIACSNTFITCFNGMAVEQACPFGQFFHAANKVCDYKDNVPGCLQTKGSKIGGSIGNSCAGLRSGNADIPCQVDEVCKEIERPVNGRYLCPAPFAVWYGPLGANTGDQWTLAPDGLRCGEDGRWYNGNEIVSTPAVDCTAKRSAMGSAPAPPQSDNAKAAARGACPGLLTGKDSEGIPCDADEVCQAINRPKNGKYSCEAPFSVFYGPVRGASEQWKEAKEGLLCGSDGFWYASGVKVDASGIDCTAKKSQFQKADDETQGCPSLSTNEREIPCKGDEEVCQPILKAVAGKYACPTPYRVWYGPRGVIEADWKQAKDALICKGGSWFDGDVKIDATAVDCTVKKIECSKLGDGTYNGEPGRCSTHFWQCSNEQAYLYPCAPGLFFDDFSKTCDYKEVVESCGGTRRSPAAATTTAAPAADAVSLSKTECSSLLTDSTVSCKDGDTCVAPADPVNQKYLCETPYTLSFGPKSNANQWREAPNGIQCKNGQWFNGEEQIKPEAVHCTTTKFACTGKKDGSYSAHPEKCTAYFWNCAHDDSFLYTCPAGLFFDVDTLSCDYKEVIVACGGMKKDAPKNVQVPSSDVVVPSFDCSGKDNGYHETGKCEKKFWNCADGKSFQIDCPEGLVYDGRVQLCQYPLACSADLPATTTPSSPPSTLDHGDFSKKPVGPTTSFDCSTKSDGLYAEKKCPTQYVQCTNGRTFAKECPAGLVFVTLTQSCDYKQVCMNPPTTVAPSTTPAADPVSTTYSAYATYERVPVTTTKAPVAPPTAFDKPNCANLEDGAHAMSRCGQEFFLCWHGDVSFSKCNDGLVFNPLNTQCDYRSNVIECGAAADATPATPGQPAPPSPPVASPAPDLFCEGRTDGHFGSGCQSFFYSCQSGATLKMFCPMGLFYDADSKTCDMREIIVACGGKKESPVTPAAAPVAPASAYMRVPTIAPVKDIPVNKFCVGKEDGFYAAPGCNSFFYSCQNGLTYNMGCPTDLFYDGTKKSCDRREDIVACGAAPVATQAPTTPAAAPASTYMRVPTVAPIKDVPIEKFCIGKEDGFYAAPGCASFFYSCQNGKAHKMNCPVDLFYDGEKKSCDRREEIIACGGTPTLAPVTPAADPSSYQRIPIVAPVKDVPFVASFCVEKVNGEYGNGCNPFFYSCQDGFTSKMTCPSGLFYDEVKRACDHKEFVGACGTTPTATLAPATTPAAAPASPYERVQPVAPVKDVPLVDPAFLCIGKEDGFYAAPGCKPFFYSCQNGVNYKMPCPSGLFYDGLSKKCDRREDVVACGATPTQTPIIPAADPVSSYQRVPTVAPLKDVPIEKFCVGKEDGFYAAPGCVSFFYSCQIGITYKMDCPSGLFYDGHQKKCDNKEEIVACGATPTQAPSTTPAAAPASSSYQRIPTVAPVKDVPIIDLASLCIGKEDGFYAAPGCNSFFYSCQNGKDYKMPCPSGLFYDGLSKKCDRREDVVACGATPTQTPVIPAADPVSSYQRVPTVAPVKDVPVEKFCIGKEDGFYAAPGCVSFFYSCQIGITYKHDCPSGLFYDGHQKKCDNKEEIVACGATPTQAPSTTPAAAPASSAYQRIPTVAPVKDTPTIDLALLCIGKEDGFYAAPGCNSFFYSCQNGKDYKMPCPSGLFYDGLSKKCDRREDVVACGSTPNLTPVTPVADPASSYQRVHVPLKDTPVVDIENFCVGKEDAFYGNGCQSFFYSCQNGATFKMGCPSGLFYDELHKKCDHKEEIVACGATPTQTPLTKPADVPVVVVENFCKGKTDGFYSDGCQSFFYSCQSDATYKMTCPSGLFYDANLKMCTNRDEIPACGAIPTTTQTPAAAPARTTAAPVPYPTKAADIPVTANFCVGKADNVYGSGCQNYFYTCQSGVSYKTTCSSDLFFDIESKQCNYRELIVACGGKKEEIAPTAAPVLDRPVVTVETFCLAKEDGFYGDGCNVYFFSCQNGATYKMFCPKGLYYDLVKKACDRREDIAVCGAMSVPSIVLAPSSPYSSAPIAPSRDQTVTPLITSDNFCAGKPDGFYGNGCANHYFTCQNGRTYKMDCPSGLFFELSSKMCDRRENVVACGGAAPVAPVIPAAAPAATVAPSPYAQPKATVAPIRDIPVAPVENFCAGKVDGIYSNGCESFYHSCTNGFTYKMDCPAGLVYDVASKLCDVREKVPVCGGVRPIPPVVPARAPPSQVENFCTGKIDGVYTIGCQSFYYSCTNGYTHKMTCPSGLYFEISSRMCEVRENVAACGGVRPAPPVIPAAVPAAPIAPSAYVQPAQPMQPKATAAPVRDIPVVPVDNFCSGKVDGVYATGCQSFYHSCTNGYTYKMDCPSGLFYEVSSRMCEVRENVAACGGTRPSTPAAAPSVPVAPSAYAAPKATASPMTRHVPVENFCTGKADGVYSNGCDAFFHSCSNGMTYKMNCPSGLVYDISTKMCDVKENIVACGGVRPVTPTIPAAAPPAPVAPSAYVVPKATASPARDAPVEFCSGKADGVYSNGCDAYFHSCSNGITYKMNCPSGLVYDISTKMCDLKDNIAACGGRPVAPVIPAAAPPAPVAPSAYAAPKATASPMTRDVPVENFCAGKADGVYSNGCDAFFHSCSNGVTYKMNCPSGLVYDISTKMCDVREKIVACGGVRPVTPVIPAAAAAAPAPSPYSQPMATVAPVRDVIPVVPVEQFCSGKADGIYNVGCDSFYYSCSNGFTYKMLCPSGLFYDAPSALCNIKEHVVACGGKQNVSPVAPLLRDQPAPPLDPFCNGKVDGYYGNGCATEFYSCSAGVTYKIFCPSGLFYDVSKKACNYREQLVGCGAAAAAPAAPAAYSAPAAPVVHAAPQYSAPAAPSIAASPAVTAAPAIPSDNFCAGKAEGIYTVGCASFYYNCVNGYTHKMNCPSGLFFEVSTKLCDRRENVVACGGQQLQQQQPQTQYQPAPVSPVRDVVAPNNGECTGKADGYYGEKCRDFFYYCSNGMFYKQVCATGLFYDITSKQCEYREKACGVSQPAPAAAPAAPAYSRPAATVAPAAAPAAPAYSRPAATAAPAAAPAAPAEYARPAAPARDKPVVKNVNDKSCTGQVDGFFGEGCNDHFFSCLNGAAYKMACPAGLFYDLELQSCEYKDNVPNCGGRRVEVTATASPVLAPPASVDNSQCSGKKDGVYAAADCSQEFVSCQSGLARKEACQQGLFYNEVNGMCDYRENVIKCSARDTLPTRAPSAEYGRPASRPITRPTQQTKYDSHKAEYQKKPALSPVAGTSCGVMADGYYSNGCSTDYHACVSGQSMAMHCPSNLMYSAGTQMCDYPDNVPECGGSVPALKDVPSISPRPLYSSTQPPIVPITPASPLSTQKPAKEVHPRCAGREDGIYALAPCSQNYIACVDEKATIGICRDDLHYSTVSGLCDWKEKIPACTMLVRPTSVIPRAVPTTTPIPATVSPTRDVVRPIGERLIRPTLPLGVHPDCSQIADGVYAVQSCAPYYNRCTGGRLTARGTCPRTMVFSPAAGSCVSRSALSSCSTPVVTPSPITPQTPALSPAQPNYGVQPAQQQPVYQQQQYGGQQQMQQPTYSQQYAPSYNTYSSTYASGIYADPTQFCYGKANGIYGNTCQKSYVICQSGATFAYQCPNEFLFNRERGVCDHPSRMPQCGGPTYGYSPAASYQQTGYQQQQQNYSPY